MKPIIIAKDIHVEYHNRDILNIDTLSLYNNQRIGIVGDNGSGKSTLMKILVIELEGYNVEHFGSIAYIPQLESLENDDISRELQSKLNILDLNEYASGGERMRQKIAAAFTHMAHAILVDEPTNNLDQEGIEDLISQLKYYPGAVVIISHDRYVLNELVDTIWEIDAGNINVYPGNYEDYAALKKQEFERQSAQHDAYHQEVARLKSIASTQRQQAQKMNNKKTKRTERGGRLAHAKGNDSKQKALNRKAKEIEKRLNNLTVYESPKVMKDIQFRISSSLELHNPYPIYGRDITKAFETKTLYQGLDFDILLGSKTALLGPNGSGKTQLLKMILNKDDGIEMAPKVKIGYFQQDAINNLPNMTLLEYLMEDTDYQEHEMRALMDALGFSQQDIQKDIQVMSGGERMKLKLGKLFTGQYNVLLLDEPTNNLDLKSIKAIESLLKSYTETLVLVSHDQTLIKNVCDRFIQLSCVKIDGKR